MPINHDKNENSKSQTSTATSMPGQDKPSAEMDASGKKDGSPTNAPGRNENNPNSTTMRHDGGQNRDDKKQSDPNRDQKIGKSHEAPNKGV